MNERSSVGKRYTTTTGRSRRNYSVILRAGIFPSRMIPSAIASYVKIL